ncbi:hypothetical protein E2C01_072728 [Portunus trituberculatus]|uniref:Uncharacterized protein n=1 Tax=Portunus trituberculatus TaxID=210409 RepID=A0A5B7I7F6_PORTR|nr:hypothetical protein [Portunus trituberculatus]
MPVTQCCGDVVVGKRRAEHHHHHHYHLIFITFTFTQISLRTKKKKECGLKTVVVVVVAAAAERGRQSGGGGGGGGGGSLPEVPCNNRVKSGRGRGPPSRVSHTNYWAGKRRGSGREESFAALLAAHCSLLTGQRAGRGALWLRLWIACCCALASLSCLSIWLSVSVCSLKSAFCLGKRLLLACA